MKKLLLLSLGALGVVYGDIGTSPLYAINEIFFGHAKFAHSVENILGGISLVVWALTIIITIKYIIFVLKADNDGEGGVFSLFGLLHKKNFLGKAAVLTLFIFASGLLFGDGFITPAISVISAIEGLKVATVFFDPYIIPITIAVLTGLFLIQSRGTGKIGMIFGPVIIFWFLAIGSLGFVQIIQNPIILQAFNPYYAIKFLFGNSLMSNLFVLGSVMLVITGGEAMYADMGHFGKKPIRLSWFSLVYPALLLNYLGQGAYLLGGKSVVYGNIFFSLAPKNLIIPMVILATMATIIASQALISGVYSLTVQAINLNLLPFTKITHTNKDHHGQIYVPFINWFLYIGCITLVLIFRSSSNLAAVYGLAVSGDMVINTIGMFFIATLYWKWKKVKALPVFLIFGLIELGFLLANSLKILNGGYIPLLIALFFLGIMSIWRWGTRIKENIYKNMRSMLLKDLIKIKEKITENDTIARSSIFMTTRFIDSVEDHIPIVLETFHNRYRELPKDIIMLNVFVDHDNSHLHEKRYEIIKFFENGRKGSIYSIQARFGFMEEPNVEELLENLAEHHEIRLELGSSHWLVHALHKRVLFNDKINLLTRIKISIYQFLDNISMKADHYFGLGNEVELTVEVVPVKFEG